MKERIEQLKIILISTLLNNQRKSAKYRRTIFLIGFLNC